MRRFTYKQILEKENLEWFSLEYLRRCKCPEPDEKQFIEYLELSERGIDIARGKFNFYAEAKRMRGITIHELWEPSFYAKDCSWLGYYYLLQEEDGSLIPEHIAVFISQEIFRGQDRELIMNLYKREIYELYEYINRIIWRK